MILGFMLGWAAATWYWAWIASLYDKPLLSNGKRYERVGDSKVVYGRGWRRDGGP